MRGAQPWKTNRSRALRSRETSAEARLWGRSRNRQLGGLKFIRQHPIGPYFVDFLCREKQIVVEIEWQLQGCSSQRKREPRCSDESTCMPSKGMDHGAFSARCQAEGRPPGM